LWKQDKTTESERGRIEKQQWLVPPHSLKRKSQQKDNHSLIMTYREGVAGLSIDHLGWNAGIEGRVAYRTVVIAPPVNMLGSDIVGVWGCKVGVLMNMSGILANGMRGIWGGRENRDSGGWSRLANWAAGPASKGYATLRRHENDDDDKGNGRNWPLPPRFL
jgi:hypothetical protein